METREPEGKLKVERRGSQEGRMFQWELGPPLLNEEFLPLDELLENWPPAQGSGHTESKAIPPPGQHLVQK